MINEEKIIATVDPTLYSFIKEENNIWKVDANGIYYKNEITLQNENAMCKMKCNNEISCL